MEGEIHGLRFESDVQVAPGSLPALEPGLKTIRNRDASARGRQVRIEFGYDPGEIPRQ